MSSENLRGGVSDDEGDVLIPLSVRQQLFPHDRPRSEDTHHLNTTHNLMHHLRLDLTPFLILEDVKWQFVPNQ